MVEEEEIVEDAMIEMGMEDEPRRTEQGGSRHGEVIAIESAQDPHDAKVDEAEADQEQQEEVEAHTPPTAIATTIATPPPRPQENPTGPQRRRQKAETNQETRQQ